MLKSRIVDELGESALLLPELVNRGLAANDRVKYYFTVLQSARDHADRPGDTLPELRLEREASGVDDPLLDEAIRDSTRGEGGTYHIPGAAGIHRLILDGIGEMLAPIAAVGASQAADLRRRLQRLDHGLSAPADAAVSNGYIQAMTRVQTESEDSPHRLVMDLHKALNRLQAELAPEVLDGARVHGLEVQDRPRVQAFMAGLHDTAALKFDHPGLDTTATRSRGRLVIQNDIGTTDAHVLVLHVQDLQATLTYTDVHLQRARFFQSLFEPFGVDWEDTRSRAAEGLGEDPEYYLCVGRYSGEDEQDLQRYLRFLGSRIVFLIDWNRARKRLRPFLPKREAVALLKWAADHNVGHRGFLQLGGEQLVFDAIDYAASTPLRYGQRLDQVLGRDAVVRYLRNVFQVAADGLLEQRSERLIRDEIKAGLLNYFQSARQGALATLAEHAELITELAAAVRDALVRAPLADARPFLERTALRAKRWETRADELLNRIRDPVRPSPDMAAFAAILEQADDAADSLEEVAFLLNLVAPAELRGELQQPLHSLADLVVEGSQALVRALECAAHIRRGADRQDIQEFLQAVDRLIQVEHRTDLVERQMVTTLVQAPDPGAQALYLLSRMAETLEQSTDSLCRCALMLKDHLFREAITA